MPGKFLSLPQLEGLPSFDNEELNPFVSPYIIIL